MRRDRRTHSPGRVLALTALVQCCIEVGDDHGVRVVRVAGCLAAVHVPDLLDACWATPGTLRVDLSDVSSIDAVAAEGLRRVRDAGAQLQGVPRHIQLRIDSGPLRPRGR